jgi:NAD(P)-dependent dehydrogenase (short-subunit alcohol dehydrogenase family)
MSRNVVITGGAGGLGRVMRDLFLASGDRVHVCDVTLDNEASGGHDHLRASVCDIGSVADVERLFVEVGRWMPRVDVLVNNVGIAGPRAPIEQVSEQDWLQIIHVNLLGAIRCMQHVLPAMKEARSGAVLNVSTSSVVTRPLHRSPYNVTKAALEALTLSAARELGPYGVRCNAVRPGMMDNERMHRVLRRVADQSGKSVEEVLTQELQFISMRSMVSMEEVAQLAWFLCSPHAAHITGQLVAVDGGSEWES